MPINYSLFSGVYSWDITGDFDLGLHGYSYQRGHPGTSLETMTWDCMGIIESVDSICRNSAGTHYMIMQKSFKYLQNSKLINLYSNVHPSLSAFVTNNTPSGTK